MLHSDATLSPSDLIRILEENSDGIVLCDASGRTIFINRAAELCMGVSAERLVGKPSHELAEAGIITQAMSSRTIQSGASFTSLQTYPSGVTAIATSTPIFAPSGELSCILLNLRNVTALRNSIILDNREGHDEIGVFHSHAMQQVLVIARSLALVPATVLITGESGVGKDVVAKYIHSRSPRRGKFIKVNCGAIPEHLLESELFGYEAGAFTGARKAGKTGIVEEAREGTLFLDEVGELPLSLQPKLLEFLQDFSFNRVGGTRKRTVVLRVVAATNRDLAQLVSEGRFRQDLFYRLNVVPLHVPPLRERPDDVMPLVERQLGLLNARYDTSKQLDDTCRRPLLRHSWPGNVRELLNLCERLVVTTPEQLILPVHLRAAGLGEATPPATEDPDMVVGTLQHALDEVERRMLRCLLQRGLSSYAIASRLGLSQSTAARKIRRHFPHGVTE